jgi:hypothetical protein
MYKDQLPDFRYPKSKTELAFEELFERVNNLENRLDNFIADAISSLERIERIVEKQETEDTEEGPVRILPCAVHLSKERVNEGHALYAVWAMPGKNSGTLIRSNAALKELIK